MKKILFIAAVATMALGSCQKGQMKPSLGSDIDTLSYEIGLANSSYVQGAMQQGEIDSTLIDEYLAGVKEGLLNSQDAKKKARYLGIMFGMQSGMQLEGMEKQAFGNDSTIHLSRRNYLAGVLNGAVNQYNLTINGQQLDQQGVMMDVQSRYNAIRARQFEQNRKDGVAYMEKNAKAEGVQTLENGVQYKVLVEGTGEKPSADKGVKIYYEGRTIDGTVFDSNYGQPQPMSCVPMQMVPGFGQALTEMPVGSEWEITIPSELAYGDREMGGAIAPYSVLIFKVKVVSIDAAN